MIKTPKFKITIFARTSKYKDAFAKVYVLNWSAENFAVTNLKNTVLWTYIISSHNGEETVRKNSKKRIKESLRLKR